MSKTKKLIVSFVLVVSILFAVAVPAFAAEPADDLPSYFALRYAADQLEFSYEDLNQDSDRLFFTRDGVVYVGYFNLADTFYLSNSNPGISTTCFKTFSYSVSDACFVPSRENNDMNIPFCHVSEILYSEKDYSFKYHSSSQTFLVEDNTSSMHYSLQNLVFSRDLSGVWETIKALLPILLPAIVLFLAFRKGWSFLKGETATA